MELKKNIQYYNSGEILSLGLKDENNKAQGEFISYNKDGSIHSKGFSKNSFLIGRFYVQGKSNISSFVNLGKKISEQEHKKELAMVRLGLIEVPELSYFVKDYDEKGKIN
jgi:antitoxin component YwqK of YwqJK toxin-antitoxin module